MKKTWIKKYLNCNKLTRSDFEVHLGKEGRSLIDALTHFHKNRRYMKNKYGKPIYNNMRNSILY